MFSFLGSKGADTLLCICTYQLGGNLFMRRLISVIKIRVLASKIAIHLQEVVLYSKITFILSTPAGDLSHSEIERTKLNKRTLVQSKKASKNRNTNIDSS